MNYIKLILILSLQYFILCKVTEDEQNIYKFSLKQTNDLTNLDSNNISYDIIFDIYSRDKIQSYGWIIILKYSNNNKNYFKSKNKKKFTKIINEDYYKLIPNHIDIEEFEDPNFSFNNFSYLKPNKNKEEKFRFVNKSPLIKFTFTKNGIINIYRPDNIPDLDFFDFVQSLNRIIFVNRDKFFKGQSFKNEKEEKSSSKNLKDNCENMNFNLKIFSFKYMRVSLRGYINSVISKNNEMSIIFRLTYKILKNKENELFSLGVYRGSSEVICSFINILKEFEKKIEKYINNKEVINIIYDIIKIINIKDLFTNPSKILKIIAEKFSKQIMNLLTYLLGKITDFINKYFGGFTSQILKYFISLNNSFMKSFFPSDNSILKEINKNYENLMNSEFKKKIVENIEYSTEKIKKLSSKVFEKGYEKVKDFKSAAEKTIKYTCEEMSNSIKNKVKGIFPGRNRRPNFVLLNN